MVKFGMSSATVHLVIVVLVFVELASMAFSSKADVNIYHEIQGSDTIQVKCTKGSGYWATHFAPVSSGSITGGDSVPASGAPPNTTASSDGRAEPRKFVCGPSRSGFHIGRRFLALVRTACGM
jgi:hypothetical protein